MRTNHKGINTVQSKMTASDVWAQQAFLGSSDLVSTLLPGHVDCGKLSFPPTKVHMQTAIRYCWCPTADGIGLTKYRMCCCMGTQSNAIQDT